MKLHVFATYDSAVGAFNQPFFARSIGEAIRSFQDACNDPKSPFYSHSGDFSLFMLGYFDDASGMFDLPKAPEQVTSAREMIMKNVQE